VYGGRRRGASRPCAPVPPRDNEKTPPPPFFDVFVAALNIHEIWVQKRAEKAQGSKRTGDFGAACEEAAKQRLQTQKHCPWQL